MTKMWFEEPGAFEEIDKMLKDDWVTETEAQYLRDWIDIGYFVMTDAVPLESIRRLEKLLDDLWFADRPIPNMTIDTVQLEDGGVGAIKHSELLEIPADRRAELKLASRWRIHALHSHSPIAREVTMAPRLIRMCELLVRDRTIQYGTNTFVYGSEQALHHDSILSPLKPQFAMVGMWIPLEEIDPDSGPFTYYPRSHGEDTFPWGPTVYRRDYTKEQFAEYRANIKDMASRYEAVPFLGSPGEVLFYHNNLLHGGSAAKDRTKTRKSIVSFRCADYATPPAAFRDPAYQGIVPYAEAPVWR